MFIRELTFNYKIQCLIIFNNYTLKSNLLACFIPHSFNKEDSIICKNKNTSSPSPTSYISSSDQRNISTIKIMLKEIPHRIIASWVIRIKNVLFDKHALRNTFTGNTTTA